MRTYSKGGTGHCMLLCMAGGNYGYAYLIREIRKLHPRLTQKRARVKLCALLRAMNEDGLMRDGGLTRTGFEALEELHTGDYVVG